METKTDPITSQPKSLELRFLEKESQANDKELKLGSDPIDVVISEKQVKKLVPVYTVKNPDDGNDEENISAHAIEKPFSLENNVGEDNDIRENLTLYFKEETEPDLLTSQQKLLAPLGKENRKELNLHSDSTLVKSSENQVKQSIPVYTHENPDVGAVVGNCEERGNERSSFMQSECVKGCKDFRECCCECPKDFCKGCYECPKDFRECCCECPKYSWECCDKCCFACCKFVRECCCGCPECSWECCDECCIASCKYSCAWPCQICYCILTNIVCYNAFGIVCIPIPRRG